MVSEGKEGSFEEKRANTQSTYLKTFAEDCMFLFKGGDTIFAKVNFTLSDSKLLVEKWEGL